MSAHTVELHKSDLHYALRRLGVDLEAGVWVALYSDKSSAVPFATEIEALRYAVEHSMDVKLVPFGADIFQHKAES